MNGRQFTFGISGRPLAQFLAMIVMGVVLVTAVLMGAFVLLALLGVFVIGYVAFRIRSLVAHAKVARPQGRSAADPSQGPRKAFATSTASTKLSRPTRTPAPRLGPSVTAHDGAHTAELERTAAGDAGYD